MKHIKQFDLSEGESFSDAEKKLVDIKREIYLNAKKEYMNAIFDSLDEYGFKDIKMTMSEDMDNFSSDSFTCKYDGAVIKLKMSNRGVSVAAEGKELKNFPGSYSVKIKSLLKKVIANLEQNRRK